MLTRRERLRKLYKALWHQLYVREHRATPVFIFGEMRSGTNMLTDCLDRSMSTTIFNETDQRAFDGYVLRDKETISRLIRRSRATHVIFKSLADSARAVELLEQFPSAKAVWIFRNYKDVVNSAMRKWTEHNKYLAYIIEDSEKAGWRATNLPGRLIDLIKAHYERGLDDVSARALIWFVRNSLLFDQQLDSREDVHLVRYEELVQKPGVEFEKIFAFLELPLRETYYDQVSKDSICRDRRPDVDKTIDTLCRKLFDQLVMRAETGRAP